MTQLRMGTLVVALMTVGPGFSTTAVIAGDEHADEHEHHHTDGEGLEPHEHHQK